MIVGVVGKPNVGKSTFFKALTLADAEIAAFPFTTIKANIGMGYARSECACKHFDVDDNPQNSYCRDRFRFTPIKVIDVAGLVPGAHEGKGLGNQFLDELRQADALVHVVDISGRTDDRGEATEDHDPEKDIRFLEDEIDLWFASIIKKNWEKVYGKIKFESKDLVKELAAKLSGLKISENNVNEAIKRAGLEGNTDWGDDDIKSFAINLRESSKPIIIAANKIDLDRGDYERLKDDYDMIPVCAEAELALREADMKGLISYVAGNREFEIVKEMGPEQKKALGFIKENIMESYGNTGVQQSLNSAVFDVLKQIVVYPVENDSRLADKKDNVLPDSYLITEGATALDLAYKVHTDIGDRFIQAIDCKTKMKIGKDHVLKDEDVIKIIAGR